MNCTRDLNEINNDSWGDNVNQKLRFNCSIDNERAIQLRLPVGEGFESSNGTSVGGGNRYIYQIESNQSSSRDQFNQSNSTKPPITNHTDIVTTSTTSINWCPLLLSRSLLGTIFDIYLSIFQIRFLFVSRNISRTSCIVSSGRSVMPLKVNEHEHVRNTLFASKL